MGSSTEDLGSSYMSAAITLMAVEAPVDVTDAATDSILLDPALLGALYDDVDEAVKSYDGGDGDGGDEGGGGGNEGGGGRNDGSGEGEGSSASAPLVWALAATREGRTHTLSAWRTLCSWAASMPGSEWAWRHRGAISSAGALVLCDLIAQVIVEQRSSLDNRRIVALAIFGAFWKGPLLQAFYDALDKMVPGKDARCVFIKLLVDQTAWAWSQNLIFLTYLPMAAAGECFEEAWADMKAKFWPLQMAAYKIWPLAHIINYSLVPAWARVIYVNTVGFFWCVIMCMIARGKREQLAPSPAEIEALA